MNKLWKKGVALLLLSGMVLGSSMGVVRASDIQSDAALTPPQADTQTKDADIRSDEAGPDQETIHQEQSQAQPEQLPRVLMDETFENGDGWHNHAGGNLSFADGKAIFQGAGPNPHMISKNTIFADDMLIHVDLQTLEGNTNCNAKIGFRGGTSFDDARLQVRFDFPNNRIYLEKAAGNSVQTKLAEADVAGVNIKTAPKELAVDILMKGDHITVWLNRTQIIDVRNAEAAKMPQGPILVAGQYPAQAFALNRIVVSTDQKAAGQEIPVTLKVFTDGKESGLGGVLQADRQSGYHGDTVKLTVKANHGYVFDKFTTNTDNLIVIQNNQFQLNNKFDHVVVTAHFVTRQPGKDEVYFEDFGGAIQDLPEGCKIEDERLTADPPADNAVACYRVPTNVFDKVKGGEGYRIELDAERMTANNGTFQIAFRAGSGQDDRYVLAVNSQGAAMILRFVNGQRTELKKASFQLQTGKVNRITMEIVGDQVTVSIDGKAILSYTDPDQWHGMKPQVLLMNMTKGAKIAFDNVLIERVRQGKPITVVTMLDGEPDKEHTAGTVTQDLAQAAAGDHVTLTTLVKAGYRIKSCTFAGEGGTMDSRPVLDEHGVFTMPEGSYTTLKVTVEFEKASNLQQARTYYIDAEGGKDDADGLTEQTAWKTVSGLKNRSEFHPGDKILLRRGSVFQGQQLAFQGMGTKEKPIVVDAYGDASALPRLEGQGKIENVVSLENQQYITIRNLEITNLHPEYNQSFALNQSNNTKTALRAVNVSIKDFGVASGIHIESCYIHDINGRIDNKWNGGVFFDVQATIENGRLMGIPSKYDDVSITGCTFERVDRSAIKLVSSRWCNQWLPNDPGVPLNWYPSTNVVVRDNYMDMIGGDGITVRDTDGALIENNLAKDCRYQNTGYNVGIWPFEAANTVIQYNESFNTHGTTDGQGFDCDHASSNSVMQYNYSHNNEGGFMLIMGGYNHIGATVRYNISQNDRDKVFEFAQGIPLGTMIYNNTLYSDQVMPRGLFLLSNTGNGQGIADAYLFNNVFLYPAGQQHYHTQVNDLKQHIKLYNNAYVGGIQPPDEEDKPLVLADAADAGLVNPGHAPESNSTHKPLPHDHEGLLGYQLLENSVLRDKGVTLQQAMKHFGVSENGPVDGRGLSPRQLFDEAKAQNRKSIDCVVGENFPTVAGVRYDQDFFGKTVSEKPDLGAAEFVKEAPKPEPTEPEVKPTEPEVKPTEPEVKPTEPEVKPTEPEVKPTEPEVKPTEPETKPTVPSGTASDHNRPATGDESNVVLYVVLLAAAGIVLVTVYVLSAKNHKKK